jgi:hypothetical protein
MGHKHLVFLRIAAAKFVQRSLYNVWLKTSELRKSVAMQRIKLQQARQAHKLWSILSKHVSCQVFTLLTTNHVLGSLV